MRFWEERLRITGQNNLVAGCALRLSSKLPIKAFVYGMCNYFYR